MPKLVERYDAFAIDLDGVVWRGMTFLRGALEGIESIRGAGKPILFLTNNASYSPRDVVTRLRQAGSPADENEVLTSADVAERWVVSEGFEGKRALVLGSPYLGERISKVAQLVGRAEDDVDLVMIGRDLQFDFSTLNVAASAVRNGAPLVAVNRDLTLPVEGRLEPGTGALVAAVEAASGVKATVLGKPEAPMMDAAREIIGDGRVIMIGDRPESDVAGARRVGWDAALVRSEFTGGEIDPAPDFLLDDLGEVAREIERYQGSS